MFNSNKFTSKTRIGLYSVKILQITNILTKLFKHTFISIKYKTINIISIHINLYCKIIYLVSIKFTK